MNHLLRPLQDLRFQIVEGFRFQVSGVRKRKDRSCNLNTKTSM